MGRRTRTFYASPSAAIVFSTVVFSCCIRKHTDEDSYIVRKSHSGKYQVIKCGDYYNKLKSEVLATYPLELKENYSVDIRFSNGLEKRLVVHLVAVMPVHDNHKVNLHLDFSTVDALKAHMMEVVSEEFNNAFPRMTYETYARAPQVMRAVSKSVTYKLERDGLSIHTFVVSEMPTSS